MFDLADVLKGVPNLGTSKKQLEYIKRELIDPDPNNFYSLTGIEELAANIQLCGLQQPILVRPIDGGRYMVVSGHRRRAAIELLAEDEPEKWEEISCLVERDEASPELQQLRLIYANANTRTMTGAELAEQAAQVEKLLYQLKEQGYEFPGVYVSSLAGFGYTLSPTYADLTRGFFLAVSGESEPQGTVPFTVYFTRNAYAVYQSFVDWLAAAGTVILCYNPTGDQEYRRDVDVNFLQKGELNEVGWLEVPSSFYVKTPWYKPYATTLSLETAGGDSSKRYDYVYDSSLMYGVDSSGSLAGELRGGGHIPGSLELSYYGAITNPKIRMVGNLSGKTFGICSVTAVLIASDRLEYSSRREQSYVRKVSADGTVTDLLDSLDLSTTPFPHIPVDEPVTISIEADAAFTGSADLTLFYYYRSV